MPDDTQNVPQWFSDFAVKNADEHGQLAARIEAATGELSARMEASFGRLATEIARAETRSTRWMIGVVIGSVAIGVSVLTVAMTLIVN